MLDIQTARVVRFDDEDNPIGLEQETPRFDQALATLDRSLNLIISNQEHLGKQNIGDLNQVADILSSTIERIKTEANFKKVDSQTSLDVKAILELAIVDLALAFIEKNIDLLKTEDQEVFNQVAEIFLRIANSLQAKEKSAAEREVLTQVGEEKSESVTILKQYVLEQIQQFFSGERGDIKLAFALDEAKGELGLASDQVIDQDQLVDLVFLKLLKLDQDSSATTYFWSMHDAPAEMITEMKKIIESFIEKGGELVEPDNNSSVTGQSFAKTLNFSHDFVLKAEGTLMVNSKIDLKTEAQNEVGVSLETVFAVLEPKIKELLK